LVHGENSFFIKKTEIAKEILSRIGIPDKEESLQNKILEVRTKDAWQYDVNGPAWREYPKVVIY